MNTKDESKVVLRKGGSPFFLAALPFAIVWGSCAVPEPSSDSQALVADGSTPFAEDEDEAQISADELTLQDAVAQLTADPPGTRAVRAIQCAGPVGLYAYANERYVSAELGYTGGDNAMLRARATVLGPWERYDLCYDDVGRTFTFFARGNGRFVSAELGYTGGDYAMLRARATAIGPWERFTLTDHGSFITIRSVANGRYVSAELGYTGGDHAMLRARATAIGPWEQFD